VPTKRTVRFEASANLQRLIGRDLIPNDEMAIVELVKNAYDSHAKRVHIFIQPTTEREPGRIRISDDGSGMSEGEIARLFMFAGYSQRPDEVGKTARVPTGEKGIGRFAADKLGRTLDVFTKKSRAKDGLHLVIDWKAFDDRLKKFNEVEATYTESVVPGVGVAKSGTVLEIRHLRAQWDTAKIVSLRTDLGDLLSPFTRPKDFEITLEIAGARRSASQVIEPVRPEADWSVDVSVSGDRIHRVVKRRSERNVIVDEREGSSTDLAYLRGLRARFQYFDKRPNRKASKGLVAGVRVYRDGFRIEPFGSRTADWLYIAETRAKRAGHAHIVPTRLFGFVEISRTSHPDLADTTSRQALFDTSTARSLVTVLRAQLDSFATLLESRKAPKWQENRRRRAIEVEQARLHTLGVMSFGLAHELRQPLQTIRSEAHNIQAKLAQLGTQDEDIDAAQAAIDRGVERIDQNIALVSAISKGSVTEKATCDLAEMIEKEALLFRPRCSALGIELIVQAPATQPAVVNQFAVYTVLINYLQNALEAVESTGRPGRVTVTVAKKSGQHYIEVADDGDGVANDIQPQLFRKFATRKTGGMGVGLYYCKTIIESHGGQVGFVSGSQRGARFWAQVPDKR
jgi:signal transduction histidine kinase